MKKKVTKLALFKSSNVPKSNCQLAHSSVQATDNIELQGPSVSVTWQVTGPTPPPDSSCANSGRTGRIIMGTNGDDTLIGSSGPDTINGRAGNDGINGCNGADIINGDGEDDRIAGSQGNDMLNGNAGNDLIQGGSGNDQISGGDGDDILTGGPGKDHFTCGAGIDTITDFQPGVDTKTANCENSWCYNHINRLSSELPWIYIFMLLY